jgi:hypothetical protein
MKSALIIAVVLLAGCANTKYPGWQGISLVSSVENKPCVKAGAKEQCKDTKDDCDPWFQKRATLVNANTVVVSGSGTYFTGNYFQCQPGYPAYKGPVFSKAGYGPGLNAVTGQGFSRQIGGGVVTCAGQPVVMLPDTEYFDQALSDIERGLPPDYQISKDAKEMVKTSQCDAQGNFEFRKVPSGNWIIITNVSWGVGYVGHNGFGFYNGVRQEGGPVVKAVSVQDGEPNRFIVSP